MNKSVVIKKILVPVFLFVTAIPALAQNEDESGSVCPKDQLVIKMALDNGVFIDVKKCTFFNVGPNVIYNIKDNNNNTSLRVFFNSRDETFQYTNIKVDQILCMAYRDGRWKNIGKSCK